MWTTSFRLKSLSCGAVGPDRLQELGDDVVQAVDLPAGHRQILLEPRGDLQRLVVERQSLAPQAPARYSAITGRLLAARDSAQLAQLAFHELQVDVQGVDGVADLMGDARRQQGQRLDALAFDRLDRLLTRLGGVVENERDARGAAGDAVERGGVEPEEALARIVDLELVPHDARAAGVVEPGESCPTRGRG